MLLEVPAALGLHRLQAGQILEASVRQGLVGERPEMLGRLQLGRVGGQDEEMEALGDLDLVAGMPAGSIQHQEDPFLWSCVHIPGKSGQHLPEEGRLDGGQEPPLGLSGGRTDEAADIEPLIALLHRCNRPLPNWCPYLADQRQEPDPMLIGRPELYFGARMGRLDVFYLVGELC